MPFWVCSRGLWCHLMSSQQRYDQAGQCGLVAGRAQSVLGVLDRGDTIPRAEGQPRAAQLSLWPGDTCTWTGTDTSSISHVRDTWNAYYNSFSLAEPVHFHLFVVWWKAFKGILTHFKKMPSVCLVAHWEEWCPPSISLDKNVLIGKETK